MKFPYNQIISLLDERLELNLAESTNKDLVLQEIWDDNFSAALKKLKLEYGTSQGDKTLRELIAKKLQVQKEQIVITNGAAFGIFLSILCSCEKEDEVITIQPNFPPTMDLIDGLGFKKKLIKLSFDNGYKIDEEALFNSISQKTRLIILVTPLNPTGTVHEVDEIIRISKRLKEEYPHCKLLIDETYREATYGNNKVIPTFAGLTDNIITVSSLSKCHGTPGLRIGWLYANDKDFIREVGIVKMNTLISNSVLDEFVAIQVLKKESAIFKTRRIHSMHGLNLTKKWVELNEKYIKWNEPKAGALCCIKLKKLIFNQNQIETFYASARDVGIQLASGEWFGEEKRFFRLGFGYMAIEDLIKTLDKLTAIIRKIAESGKM
jgi:aspartate/methionine/tyrosine aminotransferase